MAYTFMLKLLPNMKVIGKMICNMVLESKYMLTITNIKECLNKVKEMGKGHTILQTVKYIKDNGSMEKFKDLGFVYGQTGRNMKGIGKIIKKMEKDIILGLMEDLIRGCIETIKSMEWEHTNG